MNLHNEQQKVQKAMNAALSGLQEDPWLVQRVLANAKGEEIVRKKISGLVIFVAVMLVISMATAVAAGVIYWGRGLDSELQITEEIREVYQDTELFDAPNLSVRQNGVTVEVDQCIVDTNAAYLAFRVSGYPTEPGQQPAFEETECTIENEAFSWSASFSNGLVTNPEGKGVYPDGSVPEDYSKLPYMDENGELVYIISLWSDEFSLIGRTIRVSLNNLGVYSGKWGDVDVAVQGDWTFEWELKGSAQSLDVTGLSAPIGKTGSTLTSVHLSPIHIQMRMNVPRDLKAWEDDDTSEPYFYGVRLKDGTKHMSISEGGSTGYADENSNAFGQMFTLNRIIDPANVESLLFTSPLDDSGVIEVKIQ